MAYLAVVYQGNQHPLLVRLHHDLTRRVLRWGGDDEFEELESAIPSFEPHVDHGAVQMVFQVVGVDDPAGQPGHRGDEERTWLVEGGWYRRYIWAAGWKVEDVFVYNG